VNASDKTQSSAASPTAGGAQHWYESVDSVLEFALKSRGPEVAGRFLQSLTGRLIARARADSVPSARPT
jgi:predicted ATP-grasp superfamily ATP-dependent carboligase